MFNERMIRECAVDIGIVYGKEKNAKGKVIPVAREIDFLATSGGDAYTQHQAYIDNILAQADAVPEA